jgi:ribosomal protein S18 acetylase RimI-like enzyme
MESPAYEILPATWHDLGPLRKVEKDCFEEDAWPLIDLIGVLTLPGIVRLKALCQDEMVGFIAGDGSRGSQIGWITTVGVLKEYRQMGIGRDLLKACEELLPNPVIQLTVRASNQPAIQMYLQTGYKQTEVWERYYAGGEAGLVMQKIRPILG